MYIITTMSLAQGRSAGSKIVRGLKRFGVSRRMTADSEGSVGFGEKEAFVTRGVRDDVDDVEDPEDDDADDLDLSEWDVSRMNKRPSEPR